MSDQKKNSIKSILNALGVLSDSDATLVKALAEDAGVDTSLITKGDIDNKRSSGLGAKTEYVKDAWSEGQLNKTATREELNIGPGQEASGAGAEKMTREYSNPAAQHHGIEQAVERLGAMFTGFGKSLDAMTALMKANTDGNAAIKALLVQSIVAKAKDEEDEEDDESEVVEINASRAKSKIEAAKALVKAIKKSDDPAEIKALRKSLVSALAKGQLYAFAANSVELKKSIKDIAAKADIEVVQEEEEEDDEEGEAKSLTAKPAAAKATTDDQGNQADKEDNKNGNQEAAAKATELSNADLQKKLADALSGMAMLETTVKGMMDVVSGKSKIVDQLPVDISKAKPDAIQAILDQVENMESANNISNADAMAARAIASMTKQASEGKMDGAIAKARLEKSSPTVRALFAQVAAA